MSVRLKSLIVALHISALLWALIGYAGVTIYNSLGQNIDPMATASTEPSNP